MMTMACLRGYLSSCHDHPWNSSTTIIVVDLIEPLSTMLCERRSLLYHIDYDSLFDTIDRLVHLADKRNWNALWSCTRDNREELDAEMVNVDQELERLFINSFIPELRQFVTLQNLQVLYDKDRSFCSKREDKSLPLNEILPGYLVILLQILDSERSFWFGYRKHLYSILHKNLTFLLTILGDTPFCFSESEDVKNLLVELESLSIATWNFIYFSTFAFSKRKRKKKFDVGIHALLVKMDSFFTENLTHFIKLTELPNTTANSRSNSLHSPFVVDSLLNDLECLISGVFNLNIDDIKDQIKTLIKELASIQTSLKDIQMLQVTDICELKESRIQIREVAYEAEYLIKTYVMERLPTWYLNLRLPNIIQKVKLNRRGLQESKKSYNVRDISIEFGFPLGMPYEVVKDPEVVVESMVIGFEDSRTRILADLVGGSKELKKIFINGMPGIGKTTLAKKMYNDPLVSYHFHLRAWCVISQKYDTRKVLNDILLNLGSKSGKDNLLQLDDESLGLEIYQSLKGRRYLIVIDDVWYSGTWDDIRRYFPVDGNGSRILLTSRVKDTAPPDSIFYTPPLLSESQCCDLLLKKVFIKEPCPPELLGIAKGIASKCHGLPLAVVVVAGIIANLAKEEGTWKDVEANLNSYISDNQSKYMKILDLSYEHLPDHLKPCFLYLGKFDEDEEIPLWKVIPLWIAEGFVHTKEEKSLEQVAEDYYSDLVNRSLLMITKRKIDGGIKACSIHDLLRDMCLRKAVEANFLKHVNKSSIYEQHSHLVLQTSGSKTFCALHCHSLSGYLLSFEHNAITMPVIRVIDGLELNCSSFVYEMERICSLLHLKYLSVSAPEFPIGLHMLVNLEYFWLDIASIVSVPASILKMVKLRHVCITTEAVFEKSCDSFRTMNNLKSLSYVLIRNEEEEEILRCSPHLRKLKYVCDGSLFPDLNTLTELESLTVQFTSPPEVELIGCYFPSTIKRLSLYGTRLPWEKMTIVGSLPNLHVLKLFDCAFVGEEWNMRYGEFEQLRFLRLEDLNLKQWFASNKHLPRLQSLVLESITDLMEIPSDLGDIPTLKRIEIRNCSPAIESSAVQIEEEQRDYGNEDPKVIITNGKRFQMEDRAIELVRSHSGVTRARAVRAVKMADGDIVKAIMQLTEL